jgi:hypothetical protein
MSVSKHVTSAIRSIGQAHGAPIKLRGGSSPEQGYMMIRLNGTWRYLCGGPWREEMSEAVCRQLNFTGNTSFLADRRSGKSIM